VCSLPTGRFAVLILCIFATPAAANSAAATPLPPSPARFGVIAPKAEYVLYQPVLDRYTHAVERQFAGVASVTIVPLKYDEIAAGLAVCRRERLSGFVEPHRRWRITDASVTVDATLTVTDCDGDLFYRGHAMRARERDSTSVPQTQIDSLQAEALSALMQDFGKFKLAHEPLWDQMARTGSIEQPTLYWSKERA
jgi:hypothetical protein